jgi:two-component system sensor histidine kinase TctE
MPAESVLLRTQLLRWLVVPLIALLAADAAVSYLLANRVAQDAQDKALREIARDLALQVRRDAAGALVLELPEAARRMLLDDPEDLIVYEVLDAQGRRVAGEAVKPPALQSRPGRQGELLYDTALDGSPARAVQWPLLDAPGAPGALLRVAETRQQRDATARAILAAVVLPQMLLIALAAGIVRFGVNRGLRPLQDLQRAVAERSHKDLSPIDDTRVPGEVQPLVRSVNALLARLEEVLTMQSRFIADAAHQLKTPVAGLKAHIELLARSSEPAEREALVGRLEVGVERLSRLVSQLLALARNEPEAARMIDFRPVDLGALVLETAANWVPQALKHGIDLGLEAEEAQETPILVQGDASRLRELFDNLIDNAIRYSPPGGHVTVRVSAAPTPTVEVSDDGPRIPPQEQQRVFERFHRLLGSGEGNGLGLAIAQEIARLHQARIVVQDDADGIGNRFSVVFPRP